jgi:uncharacterized protein involved in outer membrane biogenesis
MSLKKILSLLKWIFLSFLAVFVITVAVINIPPVQRGLTRVINQTMARKGIPVRVRQVRLLITGRIGIEDLDIRSPAGDTIISAGRLRVSVNPLKLLVKKVSIQSLSLQHASVMLEPDEVTGKLNIAAFKIPAKKAP